MTCRGVLEVPSQSSERLLESISTSLRGEERMGLTLKVLPHGSRAHRKGVSTTGFPLLCFAATCSLNSLIVLKFVSHGVTFLGTPLSTIPVLSSKHGG